MNEMAVSRCKFSADGENIEKTFCAHTLRHVSEKEHVGKKSHNKAHSHIKFPPDMRTISRAGVVDPCEPESLHERVPLVPIKGDDRKDPGESRSEIQGDKKN